MTDTLSVDVSLLFPQNFSVKELNNVSGIIVGIIGKPLVGKTTLAKSLCSYLGAELYTFEQIENDPNLIQNFIENKSRIVVDGGSASSFLEKDQHLGDIFIYDLLLDISDEELLYRIDRFIEKEDEEGVFYCPYLKTLPDIYSLNKLEPKLGQVSFVSENYEFFEPDMSNKVEDNADEEVEEVEEEEVDPDKVELDEKDVNADEIPEETRFKLQRWDAYTTKFTQQLDAWKQNKKYVVTPNFHIIDARFDPLEVLRQALVIIIQKQPKFVFAAKATLYEGNETDFLPIVDSPTFGPYCPVELAEDRVSIGIVNVLYRGYVYHCIDEAAAELFMKNPSKYLKRPVLPKQYRICLVPGIPDLLNTEHVAHIPLILDIPFVSLQQLYKRIQEDDEIDMEAPGSVILQKLREMRENPGFDWDDLIIEYLVEILQVELKKDRLLVYCDVDANMLLNLFEKIDIKHFSNIIHLIHSSLTPLKLGRVLDVLGADVKTMDLINQVPLVKESIKDLDVDESKEVVEEDVDEKELIESTSDKDDIEMNVESEATDDVKEEEKFNLHMAEEAKLDLVEDLIEILLPIWLRPEPTEVEPAEFAVPRFEDPKFLYKRPGDEEEEEEEEEKQEEEEEEAVQEDLITWKEYEKTLFEESQYPRFDELGINTGDTVDLSQFGICCPVCLTKNVISRGLAQHCATYAGCRYFFCCEEHANAFIKNPSDNSLLDIPAPRHLIISPSGALNDTAELISSLSFEAAHSTAPVSIFKPDFSIVLPEIKLEVKKIDEEKRDDVESDEEEEENDAEEAEPELNENGLTKHEQFVVEDLISRLLTSFICDLSGCSKVLVEETIRQLEMKGKRPERVWSISFSPEIAIKRLSKPVELDTVEEETREERSERLQEEIEAQAEAIREEHGVRTDEIGEVVENLLNKGYFVSKVLDHLSKSSKTVLIRHVIGGSRQSTIYHLSRRHMVTRIDPKQCSNLLMTGRYTFSGFGLCCPVRYKEESLMINVAPIDIILGRQFGFEIFLCAVDSYVVALASYENFLKFSKDPLLYLDVTCPKFTTPSILLKAPYGIKTKPIIKYLHEEFKLNALRLPDICTQLILSSSDLSISNSVVKELNSGLKENTIKQIMKCLSLFSCCRMQGVVVDGIDCDTDLVIDLCHSNNDEELLAAILPLTKGTVLDTNLILRTHDEIIERHGDDIVCINANSTEWQRQIAIDDIVDDYLCYLGHLDRYYKKQLLAFVLPSFVKKPFMVSNGPCKNYCPVGLFNGYFIELKDHYSEILYKDVIYKVNEQNIDYFLADPEKYAHITDPSLKNIPYIPICSENEDLGFAGFCPITYHYTQQLLPGNKHIFALYQEKKYYFTNEMCRSSFIQHPQIPQLPDNLPPIKPKINYANVSSEMFLNHFVTPFVEKIMKDFATPDDRPFIPGLTPKASSILYLSVMLKNSQVGLPFHVQDTMVKNKQAFKRIATLINRLSQAEEPSTDALQQRDLQTLEMVELFEKLEFFDFYHFLDVTIEK
eukprot:TRINITY_DN3079_c3_g10_i1.p1 TRINITY_DN3079_c3_g10~~TRINITY_DN3079_c3_g10_i1.p1  ORF type:complete len:1509 (+),score=488.85 TRINITY_DN3079_c3_g10_i1:47-4573(+)